MTEQAPTTTPEIDITAVPVDDDLDAAIRDEHDSIPPDTRQHVLERDQCCQVCGCSQSQAADRLGLVVQRITANPGHCHPDDPDNLVVWCARCARWIEQMPGRDDLPGVLQDRLDGVDLETSRVEILEFLAENGPALTGEVADVVNLRTTSTVRRALYDLMALDVGWIPSRSGSS
jgi:DNA-binding transcriptional LysR family regulator